jgi:hypothetical protein
VIARHLRLLSADARRLLQIASVLGREFTVAEVAAMTAEPASHLAGAVEEALRAEVLAEVPIGLAFRHDLLREAAYESLPVSARLALHRDAGEALRRSGAPVVRVAAQLAIGARPGDAAAAAVIGQAVTELAPSSPSAAADLAVRAMELIGDHDGHGLDLVRSATMALGLAGRIAEAREVGERYLATHRPPAQAEAELQLELRRPWVIDRLEAYPVPLPASLLADRSVDASVAATLAALDQLPGILRGHGDRADRALDQAMRTVTASGRAADLTVIAQLRVLNSLIRGRFGEALMRAEAARAAAGPEADGMYEEMVVAALAASGRISDALARMRPALAAAHAAGRAGLIFRYRRLRAAMLLSQGHLDDAGAEARSVIDLPVELGYPGRVALPLSVMVETALRRGDMAAAQSALARYAPDVHGVLPDLHWAAALVADAGATPSWPHRPSRRSASSYRTGTSSSRTTSTIACRTSCTSPGARARRARHAPLRPPPSRRPRGTRRRMRSPPRPLTPGRSSTITPRCSARRSSGRQTARTACSRRRPGRIWARPSPGVRRRPGSSRRPTISTPGSARTVMSRASGPPFAWWASAGSPAAPPARRAAGPA